MDPAHRRSVTAHSRQLETAARTVNRLGVCLHWGWLRDEVYLDPLDLVGAGPVRLLPFLAPGGAARGSTGPRSPPARPAAVLPYAAWLARLPPDFIGPRL